MTGAPVPDRRGPIVPVEWTDGGVQRVRCAIAGPPRPGATSAAPARTSSRARCVLRAGHRLGPRHLALLAAVGRDRVPVRRGRGWWCCRPATSSSSPAGRCGAGRSSTPTASRSTAAAERGWRAGRPASASSATTPRAVRGAPEASWSGPTWSSPPAGCRRARTTWSRRCCRALAPCTSTRSRCSRACRRASARSARRTPIFTLPGNPVSSLRVLRGVRAPGAAGDARARPSLHRPSGRRAVAGAGVGLARRQAAVRAGCASSATATPLTSSSPVGGQGSHLVADLSAADALAVVPEARHAGSSRRRGARACCSNGHGGERQRAERPRRLTHVDERRRRADGRRQRQGRHGPRGDRARGAGAAAARRSWRRCAATACPRATRSPWPGSPASRPPSAPPTSCRWPTRSRVHAVTCDVEVRRRRGRDRGDGAHRRPHRRGDGGADRGRRRRARGGRHGQGARPARARSPTCGSWPRAGGGPVTGDSSSRARCERPGGTGARSCVTVSTGRGRRSTRTGRARPRRGPAGARASPSTDPLVVRRRRPRRRRAARRRRASGYDVVLTTGGTGLTADDRTPEVTCRCCDRRGARASPRRCGRTARERGVPTAVLSRGLAGVAGATLVVNLPGSPGGCRDALEVLGRCWRTPSTRCAAGTTGRSRTAEVHGRRAWPVRLADGDVVLRPLRRRDARGLACGARCEPGVARALGGDRPGRARPGAGFGADGAPACTGRRARGGRCRSCVEVDGRLRRQVTVGRDRLGLAAQRRTSATGSTAGVAGRGIVPDRGGPRWSTTASPSWACTASR